MHDESIAASHGFVDSGIIENGGREMNGIDHGGNQRQPAVNFYKQRDSESVQYLPDIIAMENQDDDDHEPVPTRDAGQNAVASKTHLQSR